MENKSSQGGSMSNGVDSGNPQVSAPAGPGPYQSDGTQPQVFRERPGAGYEGPGRGHAVKLNSDDQMPVSPS